jgi:hypothetical protein
MPKALVSDRSVEKRVSSEFRVPVRREAITLTLADGSLHEGTFFRAPSGEMDALLESEEPFVPIDEGGTLRLYARRGIAVVSVAEEEESELEALRVRVGVAVRLRGGKSVRGELRFAAERGNARSLDHLNGVEKSFAVHDGAKVHHVAKDHVEHVEERR